MKIVAIIQARMSSTRLPGKVLKARLDRSLLEYQIERVRHSKLLSDIVIATTTKACDDEIVNLCKRLNINFFRGSEENVLERYFEAAKKKCADVVVRISSDCPLIDPQIIDKVIRSYVENYPNFDYVSNTLEKTYPRGMDTEVFSFSVLKRAYLEANLDSQKEHVTPFIYQNSGYFKLLNIQYYEDLSKHRWTVDTIEDFELIKNIITSLYPVNQNFVMQDVLNLLSVNPDWFFLNSHIKQKQI